MYSDTGAWPRTKTGGDTEHIRKNTRFCDEISRADGGDLFLAMATILKLKRWLERPQIVDRVQQNGSQFEHKGFQQFCLNQVEFQKAFICVWGSRATTQRHLIRGCNVVESAAALFEWHFHPCWTLTRGAGGGRGNKSAITAHEKAARMLGPLFIGICFDTNCRGGLQIKDTRTRPYCKCSSSVDFALQSDRKFESLRLF
jgi:hypothetical protein